MKKLQVLLLSVLMLACSTNLFFSLKAKATNNYKAGDLIEFGSYPQNIVLDTNLVAKLDVVEKKWKSYGYYPDSNTLSNNRTMPDDYMQYADVIFEGIKYRAVKFGKYRNSYQEKNGYVCDTTYYFKYEPLKWRVLDADSGYVMCENIIDSQAYQNTTYYGNNNGETEYWHDKSMNKYANNYAVSSIRDWLNYDFYETAFTVAQKANIRTTELNNNAFDDYYNKFNSDSTNDKIFLLSWSDAFNSSYGFQSKLTSIIENNGHYSYTYDNTTYYAKGTDYANCQGLYVYVSDNNYYSNSEWWLRTPGWYSNGACRISAEGTQGSGYTVNLTYRGIRPACVLFELKSDNSQSDVLFSTLEEEHFWESSITIPASCTVAGEQFFTCTVCGIKKTEPIAVKGHSYGLWNMVDKMQHQRVCANDNSHVEKENHKWDDGIITTAATCTTNGVRTFTCTACNATKTEEIATKEHTPVTDKAVEATCTTDGKTEGSHCSVCNTVIKEQETVKATSHSYGSWAKLDDTHHQRICAHDSSHIEKGNHAWNNGEITTAATCTTDGVKTYTCTVCGATNTEVISKTGHAYCAWTKLNDTQHQRICANDKSHVEKESHTWNNGKVITAVTCTTNGVKTLTCTVCQATKQETISATGHNWRAWTRLDDSQHKRVCVNDPTHVETALHIWDDGQVTKAPTCTTAGTIKYTCSGCGATATVPGNAALGHDWNNWENLNDIQHQRVCANDKNHIEKANHTWDGGKVTTEPTCTEKGVTTFTCTVCGATKTEEIAAKGHTPVSDKAVAATCTADGKTEGRHCAICNAVIKAQEMVNATGHNYGTWTKLNETQHQRVCSNDKTHIEKASHTWDAGRVTKEPSCTEKGVRTYTCTACNATNTEEIAAKEHTPVTDKAVKATCTTDGKTEGSHCSVCNAVIKAQETVKATGHAFGEWAKLDETQHQRICANDKTHVEKANHTWDAGKVTTEPTCTEKGVRTYTCTVCKETRTEDVATKGHTVVTDKAVAATCTTDGKTEGSHCSVCNTVIKAQEVVKAAGHTWDESKVTKEPTSEAEGVKSFTCTVCGETKTEPIPKKAPATPTDATPTDAECKPGDVDGDGKLTSADARLALRASVGLEPDIVPGVDAYLACDVDGDGKVTSADARLILRASVGLEDASKFGKKA